MLPEIILTTYQYCDIIYTTNGPKNNSADSGVFLPAVSCVPKVLCNFAINLCSACHLRHMYLCPKTRMQRVTDTVGYWLAGHFLVLVALAAVVGFLFHFIPLPKLAVAPQHEVSLGQCDGGHLCTPWFYLVRCKEDIDHFLFCWFSQHTLNYSLDI